MAEKKVDAFELDGIRALVEIMKENDVSEVELEQDGKRLKLSRGVGVVYEREASVAPERRVEAPSAPSESRDDEACAQKNRTTPPTTRRLIRRWSAPITPRPVRTNRRSLRSAIA